MTRLRLLVVAVLAIAAASLVLGAAPLAAQSRQSEPVERSDRDQRATDVQPEGPVYRPTRSAVRIGQDYTLAAGDIMREATVIMGNAQIDGYVDGDVVVVMGSASVGSTATIGGSLVVIGGMTTIRDGAKVNRDMVSIGGGLDAPASFRPGGEYVVLGSNILGGRIDALLPWFTRGLLWGRPIVPSLPWVWGIVALFFLLYLSINLVFHQPVRTCADTIAARPLTTLLVGLLVLLLTGPVSVLLAISVIGLAIVPVVICAVIVAAVIGKVSVIRWLGMRVAGEDSPPTQLESTRSFGIGFAILCVPYMVPILGFVTFAVVGILGLGAASLAFIAGYRKENPLPPRPMPGPLTLPSTPSGPTEGGGGFYTPDSVPSPSASFSSNAPSTTASPLGEQIASPTTAPLSPLSTSPPPMLPPHAGGAASSYAMSAGQLIAFPHAGFLDRFAALILDGILILILWQMFPGFVKRAFDTTLPFALFIAYHAAFWTLKGTTVGGIICQLRIVRVDGRELSVADAIVRALAGVFSLAVLGIGFLWIMKDPEQQAWHDRIAGTYVVKVPRNWPI
ncbi:MAG TPA: RDD family protein [Vicinamibacterales bacterium]|nr:RDD family protein [Vicinamibacterales bacterium]